MLRSPPLLHMCACMRACLQAATAQRPASPSVPPVGGDGFTFEHLADREELWWDFTADTGDGGDPTYA